MCKKCNGCTSMVSELVYGEFHNFICSKLDKVIDYGVEGDEVDVPKWCPDSFEESKKNDITFHPIYGTPMKKDENKVIGPVKSQPPYTPTCRTQTLLSTRQKWDMIEPHTKWENVNKGDIYHVPPFLGSEKRFDIEIVYKCDDYFSYKKLGEYTTSYTYPNDILFKVMVKSKTKVSKQAK